MRHTAMSLSALSHLSVILDIFCSASFYSSQIEEQSLHSLPVLL